MAVEGRAAICDLIDAAEDGEDVIGFQKVSAGACGEGLEDDGFVVVDGDSPKLA